MTQTPVFATVNPFDEMTGNAPGVVRNYCGGQWQETTDIRTDIVDPLNGQRFLDVPDTQRLSPFLEQIAQTPKSGLHNPFNNPERYVALGQVCARAASLMTEPQVCDFFAKLIQRVMPKSWEQCVGEVVVTRKFLENFSGDNVRFLARGFSVPGDHLGQESRGYRWPYGPVALIAPFNFPLEIPVLQVMGALFMGNRPLVKVDSKVSVVFEQFLRQLLHVGLPATDIDLIHCRGSVMGQLLARDDALRLVQFTGSQSVAEKISSSQNGAVRLEDAGFDWKIIGPDYDPEWLDYVAWQCDQDAYNASGQKCSAQSILFVHENWRAPLIPKLRELASLRRLEDLSIGPVLTWTTENMLRHIDAICDIEGSALLFGGGEIGGGHAIPACYGALQPTACQVPVGALASADFEIITTEVFGPFQVVVVYGDEDVPAVLDALERIAQHLTAAVVSADHDFQQRVLGATVNGTTYCGMRARTTGAPQNHWFGPAGDPRAAGIGTPEAIQTTWSCHREIVFDQGPLPAA